MSFIEVCAGAGGLSSGLIAAGFSPLLLIDSDKDCCETLRQNHPQANIVQQSFTEYDYSQYVGVDLLAGGVPCQSFSQSGLRKGLEDDRGDLLCKFIELIDIIRPRAFLIENVKGLITHDGGNTLKYILSKFGGDYKVRYKLLCASKYGVPQKRERVFFVGFRDEVDFTFPEESAAIPTLRDCLQDVPPSLGAKYNEKKLELFRFIPQGGCWTSLPEDKQKEYLGKSINSGGGKRGILRRLAMDAPSLTLLCSPQQKQTERCHPTEDRPLSVREYARIQTFPDDYMFSGGMTSMYKQIGNAVPARLAEAIGRQIMLALI